MLSLLDNGGPFTAGPRRKRLSSTLLVQAVPHASRLRQMASGQGLAALHPRQCIVVCGPMLVWLSKPNLNGVVHYSFVALLLPCPRLRCLVVK